MYHFISVNFFVSCHPKKVKQGEDEYLSRPIKLKPTSLEDSSFQCSLFSGSTNQLLLQERFSLNFDLA